MNSVISRLRSEKVKGDCVILLFLLTTYGIIIVNNSLTVSCSVGYSYGTNYCNIGQINRQVKVNYMMIIMMIHGDPKNFNFVCVVCPISNTRLRLKYQGNKRCRNLFYTRFCVKRRNVELVWCSLRHAVESHVSGQKASREQGRLVLGQYSDWHLNADAFTIWHLISYSWRLFEECGKRIFLFEHQLTRSL